MPGRMWANKRKIPNIQDADQGATKASQQSMQRRGVQLKHHLLEDLGTLPCSGFITLPDLRHQAGFRLQLLEEEMVVSYSTK